jgi:uncharacterized protein (UPF0147 family)
MGIDFHDSTMIAQARRVEENSRACFWALRFLGSVGPSMVPDLLGELPTMDRRERRRAFQIFSYIEDSIDALPHAQQESYIDTLLVELCTGNFRSSALAALSNPGIPAESYLPALMDASERLSSEDLQTAAEILDKVPALHERCPRELRALVDGYSVYLSEKALEIYARRADADSLIVAATTHEFTVTRCMALRLLAERESLAGERMGYLIRALDDPNTRHTAADLLKSIGPAAGDAVPRLRELLFSPLQYAQGVWLLSAYAAAESDAVQQVETLRAFMHAGTHNDWTMSAVFAALAEAGPAAEAALPELKPFLADCGNSNLLQDASLPLAVMGPAAIPGIQILMMALICEEWPARAAGASALGGLGAAAAPALDVLDALANDSNEPPQVRRAAAEALTRIQAAPIPH